AAVPRGWCLPARQAWKNCKAARGVGNGGVAKRTQRGIVHCFQVPFLRPGGAVPLRRGLFLFIAAEKRRSFLFPGHGFLVEAGNRVVEWRFGLCRLVVARLELLGMRELRSSFALITPPNDFEFRPRLLAKRSLHRSAAELNDGDRARIGEPDI